jgi:hypothetical protein
MSEKLILHTERITNLTPEERRLGAMAVPLVVGIRDSEGSTVRMRDGHRGYTLNRGMPKNYPLSLDGEAAERLMSAYERVFTKGEPITYDCMTFVQHVAFDEALQADPDFAAKGGNCSPIGKPLMINRMQEGKPYAMYSDTEFVHAVVGGRESNRSLGVSGNNVTGPGYLIYAPNREVAQGFGATFIMEIGKE